MQSHRWLSPLFSRKAQSSGKPHGAAHFSILFARPAIAAVKKFFLRRMIAF